MCSGIKDGERESTSENKPPLLQSLSQVQSKLKSGGGGWGVNVSEHLMKHSATVHGYRGTLQLDTTAKAAKAGVPGTNVFNFLSCYALNSWFSPKPHLVTTPLFFSFVIKLHKSRAVTGDGSCSITHSHCPLILLLERC